jgi:parvulin-like peptidyl-prolyl isomerase
MKMKVGETSEPIKSIYGWHIIKLVEFNDSKQLEFEESKVKIREQLEKNAKDKLYNSWMTDLKAKYPVKKNF